MFVRSLKDVEAEGLCIDWGNGTSHRLLTAKDAMGFTVCHTVVRAGSEVSRVPVSVPTMASPLTCIQYEPVWWSSMTISDS